MKIAVDVSFPIGKSKDMAKYGYQVVTQARHAEPDEDWVCRALAQGAEVFISQDLDIPVILERLEVYDTVWMSVPQGLAGFKAVKHIINKLRRLEARRLAELNVTRK